MKKVTIVIPYILGPDNGLELRYTLRSIEKNFRHDNYEIIVIGDKPDWLTNINHVPFTRVPVRDFRTFDDQLMKLYVALTECDITNDFIWTYDDTYFTSEVKLDDIKSLKAIRRIYSRNTVEDFPGGSNWKICIMKALDDTGGKFVYETHLPRWYNKRKMLTLFDKFDMLNRPTVIATLYYNYFFKDQEPQLIEDNKDHIRFLCRSTFEPDRLEKIMRRSKFSNNNPAVWNKIFTETLQRIFPDSSKYETGPQ
ncbi:MAG: hypothetical protein WC341_16440 [Bacteroidales bacterium]|jgi:hypothetical protein